MQVEELKITRAQLEYIVQLSTGTTGMIFEIHSINGEKARRVRIKISFEELDNFKIHSSHLVPDFIDSVANFLVDIYMSSSSQLTIEME